MNNLIKKIILYEFVFVSITVAIFYFLNFSGILQIGLIIINIIAHVWFLKNQFNKYDETNEKIRLNQEKQFENSIKTIYDEHIFSITHELRSPLAVIYATLENNYNTVKGIYNSLSEDLQSEHKLQFKEIKNNIEHLRHQSEIIEKFIASISEHASYINETGDKKYIDLHKYLQSVIINSRSYSRNMRIFQDRVSFGDIMGADFFNVHTQISPHDLSRIIINIMTNAADAVTAKYKKEKDSFSPNLKIRCIKSDKENVNLILNEKFMRINTDYDVGFPYYILIEDNGTGISDENKNKIFQYGFSTKMNKESTKHQKHYGLGLYLTINLANKNSIGIFAKSDQHGTTFALGLPKIHYGNLININKTKNSDEQSATEFISSSKMSEDAKQLYKNYVDNETPSSEYKAIKNHGIWLSVVF
jgi:signal transduction histidine kinase